MLGAASRSSCSPPLGGSCSFLEDDDVFHGVKTSGLLGVFVSGVDLALVAFVRPPLVLVFGVKVDTAVGAGKCLGANFQLKILEFASVHIAGVEKVALTAFDDEDTILHGKGIRVFLWKCSNRRGFHR